MFLYVNKCIYIYIYPYWPNARDALVKIYLYNSKVFVCVDFKLNYPPGRVCTPKRLTHHKAVCAHIIGMYSIVDPRFWHLGTRSHPNEIRKKSTTPIAHRHTRYYILYYNWANKSDKPQTRTQTMMCTHTRIYIQYCTRFACSTRERHQSPMVWWIDGRRVRVCAKRKKNTHYILYNIWVKRAGSVRHRTHPAHSH